MKNFHIILTLLLATSCASLSEKECKTANWQEIGKKDGLRGYASSRLASHGEACSEYGISPNSGDYKSGYSLGNNEYCLNKGTSDGKEGKEGKTPSTCAGNTNYKSAFSKGYRHFCQSEGVKAGTNADRRQGRTNCRGKSDYNKGFTEGLVNYCSRDNGLMLGKNASDHKESLCTPSLRDDFMSGYREGIESYCTRMNGFNFGKSKKKARPHMCPSALRTSFETAYSKGIEYNSIQDQINNLSTEIEKLNTKISNPESSTDLKKYLMKELAQKEVSKRALNVRKIKIEGYIGL